MSSEVRQLSEQHIASRASLQRKLLGFRRLAQRHGLLSTIRYALLCSWRFGLAYLKVGSYSPVAVYDARRGLARIGCFTLRIRYHAAFNYLYREIFVNRVYHFQPERPNPLILDCGSNVGMSVLFFKAVAPNARIIGFEPDPNIFAVLRDNVAENKLTDVMLVNAALASEHTSLTFCCDDRLEGRLGKYAPGASCGNSIYEVPAVRLRDYLTEPVDLLKLDIEGAEGEVLLDSEDRLHLVRQLVIEYHHGLTPQPLHEILALLHRQKFECFVRAGFRFDGELTASCRWDQLIYGRQSGTGDGPAIQKAFPE
jgi:FkbM family methyltransferase